MSRRAVILAGGLGTRLRPYTVVLPKPLMPIGEYPILEIVIRQLSDFGFDHITLAVNHQADLFRAYFGDGSKWGVKLDYSLEEKPLGTMAPLKLINDLPEHFLVMNGDILTDINFADFYQCHVEDGNSIFSISSYLRSQKIDYGVLVVDDKRELTGFTEKPVRNFEVSMGVYMMNRCALDYVPDSKAYGFDDLMHHLLADGQKISVIQHAGLWLDIGRPDDYIEAIDLFEQERERLLGG